MQLLKELGVEAAFVPRSLYASGMASYSHMHRQLKAMGMLLLSMVLLPLIDVHSMLHVQQPSCAGEGTSQAGSSDAGNVVGASAKPAKGAHQTFIQVEQLQQPLCGQSRPHFFRGVATVRISLPIKISLY